MIHTVVYQALKILLINCLFEILLQHSNFIQHQEPKVVTTFISQDKKTITKFSLKIFIT